MKVKNENKINQNSSVNIRVISYISSISVIKICLKDWVLKFFKTKIHKVCIDICIIYVLQDSCNLEDNRGVGV